MDENKNLNENEQAVDISADTAQDELAEELEQVKEIFQQELDKATAEAETAVKEDEPDEEKEEEENPDLCLCCGEREKAEGKDYCEDCLDAMRHYPFKWVYFIFACLLVYLVILAGIKIVDINPGFISTYEGTVLNSAGLRDDALDKYENATNLLYRKNVYAKLVYMRSIETAFESGNVANIPVSVATIFSEWELSLPHMKKLKDYYEESQVFSATATDLNEVINEYYDTPNEELPYEEIIAKISDFEERTLYIGLAENGEEITETTTEAQAGEMSSSDETYHKRKTKYHFALIQYYKYYVADICGRPEEEKIGFLEAAREYSPSKLWLYGNELAALYIEGGQYDKALELADEIYKDSETTISSYIIRAAVYKARDKDFDKALEWCDEGFAIAEAYSSQSSGAYELYRQAAICYLAKGDYEKALENAKIAYDTYNSLSACETYAFCGLANGDTAPYDEIADVYANANDEYGSENFKFSQDVEDLKNGTRTVAEILEQGGYEIG